MNELVVPALIVHGLAHLVGFVGPWRVFDLEGVTYQSSLFDGRVDVAERTMRALGIGWLLLALAFVVTGVAAMVGAGGGAARPSPRSSLRSSCARRTGPRRGSGCG